LDTLSFNTAHYESLGCDYYQDPLNQPRYEFIFKNVGKNQVILDIGCLDGEISKKLELMGNIVIGVDISINGLTKAKQRAIKIVLANGEKALPFHQCTFDMVIASEIIEHLYDTSNFLKQIKRVMRDDGYLILTTPNLATLGNRIRLLFGKNPSMDICLEKGPGHIRYFVKSSLKDLLEINGFSIKKYESDIVSLSPGGKIRNKKLAKWFPSIGRSICIIAQKN
jgi:2-polyprenyl-3-methyl-5-hydroxy-6-metoxy-1,4-benzoquinol methylase